MHLGLQALRQYDYSEMWHKDFLLFDSIVLSKDHTSKINTQGTKMQAQFVIGIAWFEAYLSTWFTDQAPHEKNQLVLLVFVVTTKTFNDMEEDI